VSPFLVTTPKSRKAGRQGRISAEQHQRLVAAYRAFPAQHGRAAKMAGLNYRTARKAWETGLPWPGMGEPIHGLIGATVTGEAVPPAGSTPPGGPDGAPKPMRSSVDLILLTYLIREQQLDLAEKARANAGRLAKSVEELTPGLLKMATGVQTDIEAWMQEREKKVAAGAPPDHEGDIQSGLAILRAGALFARAVSLIVKASVETDRVLIAGLRDQVDAQEAVKDSGAGKNLTDEEILARHAEDDIRLKKAIERRKARRGAAGEAVGPSAGAAPPAERPPAG
jgi:hypothetical protein